MAVLDPERGAVVVRIVYDGPPFAGKTTSLRSLGRSLLASVVTPLEAAGRTVFFDWMEYTGGIFEGHPIRCQLVSVPGQPNLSPRRRALLRDADAVVFVADTSTETHVERSREYVGELARLLGAGADPAGIVVQANKRDVAGAVPLPRVRQVLGGAAAGVAVLESAAHEGRGVREAFVFAVRLALDRVRELVRAGRLPRGRPAVDDAEALLRALEVEAPAPLRPSDSVPPPAMHAPAVPRPPDASVASGAIWPAVGGRLTLHEATSTLPRVSRAGDGDWVAGLGTDFRLHSARGAAYVDLDAGRRAILAWAREHAARAGVLSAQRCIVLADTGDGLVRLWQIVRTEPSLSDGLRDAAADLDEDALLAATSEAARLLGEVAAQEGASGLPLSFDTVGRADDGARFVGLFPSTTCPPTDPSRLVAEALARALTGPLGDRVDDLTAAVRRRGHGGPVARALERLRDWPEAARDLG